MNARFSRQANLAIGPGGGFGLDKSRVQIEQTPHAFILRLPVEILLRIFLLASRCPKIINCHDCLAGYCGARALIFVCHRFYQVGVVVLYRSIKSSCGCEFVPPSIPVQNLHRSLTENPELRAHCRELHIYVPGFAELPGSGNTPLGGGGHLSWRFADDITTWLTNVREVEIWGGYRAREVNSEFLSKLPQRMPRIERLSISRSGFDTCLEFVFGLGMFRRLTSLSLRGINKAIGRTIELQCPKDKLREGSLTALDVNNYCDTPFSLRQLLLWPKVLHHFSYSDTDASTNGFGASVFRQFLAPHKETLQSIKLESLYSRSDRSCIDVSDFPNLQSITIDAFSVQCTPEEAEAKLLAPRVTTFGWSFSLNGQTQPHLSAFQKKRADWLKRFVDLAVARKSALSRVHIDFQPEIWGNSYEMLAHGEFEFPWDRMDRLGAETKVLGVAVTYEESWTSRKDWEAIIQQVMNQHECKKPGDIMTD